MQKSKQFALLCVLGEFLKNLILIQNAFIVVVKPFEGFFAHHNFCLKNIEFTRILKSINDNHYTKLII